MNKTTKPKQRSKEELKDLAECIVRLAGRTANNNPDETIMANIDYMNSWSLLLSGNNLKRCKATIRELNGQLKKVKL